MTDSDAIGEVGIVSVPTRGAGGPGEVILTVRGVRESYIADSDLPISQGQAVLVVEVAPYRHVTVVPWMKLQVPE